VYNVAEDLARKELRQLRVIDAGYRGEVWVVMANLGREPFAIQKGMKIAQMLIQPVVTVEVVEAEELDETPRGEGGFGSTGRF